MKKIIPFPGDFPLSKAIVHNYKYTMEISGLIGIDYETGKLQEGIESQTKQVMKNIKNTLTKIGWDMDDIVKARIFLADMKDYAEMNTAYAQAFGDTYPTRFALSVTELPAGALVEIECSAASDKEPID